MSDSDHLDPSSAKDYIYDTVNFIIESMDGQPMPRGLKNIEEFMDVMLEDGSISFYYVSPISVKSDGEFELYITFVVTGNDKNFSRKWKVIPRTVTFKDI